MTWLCDEREDDDNLRQLKGKWTTCMEWQSMLVVRGWCSMSVYVHLCMYVYTSCLFTYFFLTQIMKGKANWLCRTYWLIFRSRFTPKKISKKVSTSQVTVLDSVKKGRLDQLISSLISTFFLWKKQGVHELLCFFSLTCCAFSELCHIYWRPIWHLAVRACPETLASNVWPHIYTHWTRVQNIKTHNSWLVN